MSVTVTSNYGQLRPGSRLYAGDRSDLILTGTDLTSCPSRLVILSPSRQPIAAVTSWHAVRDTTHTYAGSLSLATTEVAALVRETAAGRAIACAAVVYDESGRVVSGGMLPIVSSAMPEGLDPLPPDIIGTLVMVHDLPRLVVAGDGIDITTVGDTLTVSTRGVTVSLASLAALAAAAENPRSIRALSDAVRAFCLANMELAHD